MKISDRRVFSMGRGCVALAWLTVSLCATAGVRDTTGDTIGLVLTQWRHALHETSDGKEECPDGFTVSEEAQHRAMKNSEEHRKKYGYFLNRGPHGEHAGHMPWMVEDPLPSPELKTRVGHGLNLDGTKTGSATAGTCAHEKFVSPDGEAVDNQLARVVGCTKSWRTGGFASSFFLQEIVSFPLNRILIEIRGVDSQQNDPEVTVHFYKGKDGLLQGAGGSFPPFQNQRIDERHTRYMHVTEGRIVDGVLMTDPIPDAWLPIYWIQTPAERLVRDMRLRLQLTPTGAEGFLGGYEDLKIWWSNHSRGIGGSAGSVGPFSNAWYYRAAHRYADGYPDAKSGQCTAISAAYRINAVRALIAHPAGDQRTSGKTVTAAK